MVIQSLQLHQFKNYDSEIFFKPGNAFNLITGSNGSGKTNLLDAIHFLSLGKSNFTMKDKECIHHDKDFLFLQAEIESEDKKLNSIKIGISHSKGKKISSNGKNIKKSTELLGRMPVVFVVPNDTDLVIRSSDRRRQFINRLLCQLDQEYCRHLLAYKRLLQQKHAYLKTCKHISAIDKNMVITYLNQMLHHSQYISDRRLKMSKEFNEIVSKYYQKIAVEKEVTSLNYKTNFEKSTFLELSLNNVEKDYFTSRTNVGVHRDDIEFLINKKIFKKVGSQGQIKTFIYALKFSEYEYLHQSGGTRPILLMDDIFEKLDEERMQNLFNLMSSLTFGQVFISDTEVERSKRILDRFQLDYEVFCVVNNNIKSWTAI